MHAFHLFGCPKAAPDANFLLCFFLKFGILTRAFVLTKAKIRGKKEQFS